MKSRYHVRVALGLVALGSWLAKGPSMLQAAEVESGAAVITPQQIEADWLRQDLVRSLSTQQGEITCAEDAAGGSDGIKDGKWGFHTLRTKNPWWQVDLGQAMPLNQVIIYNRCDGASQRALKLMVLLSQDGQKWTEAYRHDGSMFGGLPDGKPLDVRLETTAPARYLRIQLPGTEYLHLDEVEVFPASNNRNVALGKPTTQSSVSRWSNRSPPVATASETYPTAKVIQRGLKLATHLGQVGAEVDPQVESLERIDAVFKRLPADAPAEARRKLYVEARETVRRLALANPLLDFDRLLFVKGAPTSFSHMSDQNYGWFSRPGGGLYVLEDFASGAPKLRCLSAGLPPGNITQPDISYDGTKVLFAHCKYYPGLAELENKVDKAAIAEDAFYHLYEMNVDGSGLRRVTYGKYDDFAGRYLPSGEIVFLSTRRGQAVQCDKSSAAASNLAAQPDCYVRCGGGSERPVAVYTLHVMDAEGKNLRAISPFENFEWSPAVTNDGRILYARWDYVDRDNMPYMSLWSTLPDGTAAQAVFGNYTVSPYAMFEARAVPGSHKMVFTASAHHAITGGSLVLLDPSRGFDGADPMMRLTPEVPYPEVEAWPETYYANPYPLSEEHYLVAWSDQPLAAGWPRVNPTNALGLYLYDAFGNLELIYRDPDISSMYPIPIRPRPRPPVVESQVRWDAEQEGRMLLLDVYQGLRGVRRGTIERLRIVGVPAKTQPTMNNPMLGITRDDPGKFVLGTVPVEQDGSAYFRVPSGIPFFLQALDAEGMAVQTMRSATYVQPGQTYTCVGCHEPRNTAPGNQLSLAALRAPARITPGPEGSWPLDYSTLVQPVLDKHCTSCHQPEADGAAVNLTAAKSYETLITFGGERSLQRHVLARYRQGRSTEGQCAAASSVLTELLKQGHYDVQLGRGEWERLITWMDTYAQRTGSFGPEQQEQLRQLRRRMVALLSGTD